MSWDVPNPRGFSGVARERFKIGDHVQNSATWNGTPFRARVVGFSPKSWRVTVMREGTKMRECYHIDFIEKRGKRC